MCPRQRAPVGRAGSALCALLTFVCRAVLVARASPRSSTFFKYLWITIRAINIVLSPSMVFPWRDEQQLYAIEERFASLWGWGGRHVYRGCVGAIDGLLIRIRKPTEAEHPQPQSFFCGRYHCFGVAYQCIVDAECKFLWANGNAPGSMHDSSAFQQSELFECLNKQGLFGKYRIADDGAYADCEWMLTPWPEPRSGKLASDKDAFNWVNSTHRQVVERAFGMLVGRWLVLEHELRIPVSRVLPVVEACMKLQNLGIDRRQAAPADDGARTCELNGASPRFFKDRKPRFMFTDEPMPRHETGQRAHSSNESRRARLTRKLAEANVTRPAGDNIR